DLQFDELEHSWCKEALRLPQQGINGNRSCTLFHGIVTGPLQEVHFPLLDPIRGKVSQPYSVYPLHPSVTATGSVIEFRRAPVDLKGIAYDFAKRSGVIGNSLGISAPHRFRRLKKVADRRN